MVILAGSFVSAGGQREAPRTEPATEPAAARQYIDPSIPDSWLEAPRPASAWGVRSFTQSPVLDGRVASGELRPVAERIPEDPIVIEPLHEAGSHGGTATVWSRNLGAFLGSDAYFLNPFSALARLTADQQQIVPWFSRGWDYNADNTELTLRFYPGIRWSDGEPLTAEDYMFWWDHIVHNDELTPALPVEAQGVRSLELVDEYTVRFTFEYPRPSYHIYFYRFPQVGLLMAPSHFLKEWHPDFVDREELLRRIDAEGHDSWTAYFNYLIWNGFADPDVMTPTLSPFVVSERTETYLVAERNPYYPFVDTQGQQLPYIDELEVNLASNAEMINLQATTGEATLAGLTLRLTDMPLYMRQQEQGDYTVLVYRESRPNIAQIFPQMTHPDPKVRELMQDLRFRKALSYGMNRDEINDTLFFGQAEPRQAVLPPDSPFYEADVAFMYTEYRPDEAARLLDEIGVTDRNGDGWRQYPDGSQLRLTLSTTMQAIDLSILELVVEQWKELGLNIELESLGRELYLARARSNELDFGSWGAGTVGPLFPIGAGSWAPIGAEGGWIEWSIWHTTGGERGEEPPAEIIELQEMAVNFERATTPDEQLELGRALLREFAENLYSIGTVGLAPQPFIVSNDLRNVAETGLWAVNYWWIESYYPVQFFISE